MSRSLSCSSSVGQFGVGLEGREGQGYMNIDLDALREALLAGYPDGAAMVPARIEPSQFVTQLLAVLFPHFRGGGTLELASLEELRVTGQQLFASLRLDNPGALVADFFQELPKLQKDLLQDAKAILDGDPAAHSIDEVLIAYPGFFAIAVYRSAHLLYKRGVPILPRVLTEYAHERTGIDIHPGATIGASFCIDHGTGIVIGETAVIGAGVKIYQGVTLGALSVDKQSAGRKRHPTVEDGVVLYSNATVLGGNTVIGRDSVVGGNVWLTESIPPKSIVYHKSEITFKAG